MMKALSEQFHIRCSVSFYGRKHCQFSCVQVLSYEASVYQSTILLNHGFSCNNQLPWFEDCYWSVGSPLVPDNYQDHHGETVVSYNVL